jgi:hypothetical protein
MNRRGFFAALAAALLGPRLLPPAQPAAQLGCIPPNTAAILGNTVAFFHEGDILTFGDLAGKYVVGKTVSS